MSVVTGDSIAAKGPDGKRKHLQLYAKFQEAVLRKLREADTQHRSGTDVLAARTHTVGDLLDTWLKDELPHTTATTTIVNYRTMANVHIKPFQLGPRTMGIPCASPPSWIPTRPGRDRHVPIATSKYGM